MKALFEISARLVAQVSLEYIRPYFHWLDQPERLIGIKGSRGVGKTTLLLQYGKKALSGINYLYISLDHPWFTEHSLLEFADDFAKNGGKVLLIDEVHHYEGWSQQLKTIYDTIPDLRVIYTGSSLLHLKKGRADLSRRSLNHTLPGLSLREFISLSLQRELPVFALDDILTKHVSLAPEIWKGLKPLQYFNDYLERGYYPFYFGSRESYHQKLTEVILHILESDLPYAAGIRYSHITMLKRLLQVISESVPFKPNIQKLSERIGISKNTLMEYMNHLNDALLIQMLQSMKGGISRLTKPEKIYLSNPNLMFNLGGSDFITGTLRETFFLSQLSVVHKVNYTSKGDFLVDGRFTFEVGGKSKNDHQISGIPDSFLALDGVETGYRNAIPLWLFGFLY